MYKTCTDTGSTDSPSLLIRRLCNGLLLWWMWTLCSTNLKDFRIQLLNSRVLSKCANLLPWRRNDLKYQESDSASIVLFSLVRVCCYELNIIFSWDKWTTKHMDAIAFMCRCTVLVWKVQCWRRVNSKVTTHIKSCLSRSCQCAQPVPLVTDTLTPRVHCHYIMVL